MGFKVEFQDEALAGSIWQGGHFFDSIVKVEWLLEALDAAMHPENFVTGEEPDATECLEDVHKCLVARVRWLRLKEMGLTVCQDH